MGVRERFEERKKQQAQSAMDTEKVASAATTSSATAGHEGVAERYEKRRQAQKEKGLAQGGPDGTDDTTSHTKGGVGAIGAMTSPEQAIRRNERISQLNAEIKALEAQQSQLNAGLALDAAAELYNTKISPKKTELKQLQKAAEEEQRQELLANGYRDAGFWDVTGRSFMQGMYNDQLGTESFAAMTGKDNERQEKQDILNSDAYKFVPGNLLEEAASGLFNQLGQWANAALDTRSLAMAGVAGGSALVAGQAGPQALVPEEIISVPAAAYGGFKVGNALHMYEVEAGHAYNEMLENGISEGTARNVANVVGGVNAMLEVAQLDEVVDAYRVLRRSGATQAAADTLWKKLLDMGIDVALDTTKETGQEVLQEGVTIAGTQAASKIDTGEWAYNADEVNERLGETAESSALTFGMMNVPAAGLNTYKIVRDHEVGKQKNAVSGVETAERSERDTYTVINKLKENIPDLSGMETVDQTSANVVTTVSGNTMAEKARKLFEAVKGIVTRPNFGDVEINGRSVKDDLSHGVGPAKAATIAAVPAVIRDGKQIYFKENWKGRGYDGYVFAAPVTMDGKTVYVAAVVTQTSKNRFYLHEVVDSEGNIIKIDDGESATQTSLATNGDAGAQTPSPTVDTTIPHPADSVNSWAGISAPVSDTQMAVIENTFRAANNMFGTKGTVAFSKQFDPAADQAKHLEAFARAYNDGLRGVRGKSTTLTREQYTAAFEAGQADANAGDTDGTVVQVEKDAGVDWKDDYVKGMDQEVAKRIDQLGKDLGVRIRFVDVVRPVKGKNGIVGTANGQYSGNEILVEKNNPNPELFIAGHEFTHRMQDLAPETYHSFVKAVLADKAYFARGGTGTVEGAITAKIAQYKLNGEMLTRETAIDELVADYAGHLLMDETYLDSFMEQHKGNRNLVEKLRDLFHEFSLKIKGALGNKAAVAEQKLTKLLERSTQSAQEIREGKVQKNTATEGGGVRYSLERVDGIDYVMADNNIFKREDGTDATEREIFSSLVGTLHLPDGDIKIVKRLPSKDMYDELAKRYPKNLKKVGNPKQVNTSVNHNMRELLSNSSVIKKNEPDVNGKHQKQGVVSFDTRTVKFYDGSGAYEVEFSIATLHNGEKIAYAKKYFGYDAALTKKIQAAEATGKKSRLNQQPVSEIIISNSNGKSNPQNSESKNSLKTDADLDDEISAIYQRGYAEGLTEEEMRDEVDLLVEQRLQEARDRYGVIPEQLRFAAESAGRNDAMLNAPVANATRSDYTIINKTGDERVNNGEELRASAAPGGVSRFVEFDADGDPVFATTREEATIEAADHIAMRESRKKAAAKYGLSEAEEISLDGYIRTTFGMLNKRLYTGTLPAKDQPVVDRIVAALKKFPAFEGTTYRNLKFRSEAEYNDFLAKHAKGKTVPLDAFTSTSKRPNGYPKFGEHVVHMVIEGKTGADIADTYGVPRQQEVIFRPGTTIEITNVTTANDGNPLIYAKEVTVNGLERNHEDGRSARSTETDGKEGRGRKSSDRGAGDTAGAVRQTARDNGGSDGILSERGESSGPLTETSEESPEPPSTGEQITEDVGSMVDYDVAPDAAPHPERWEAQRVGNTDKAPMRLSEIVEKIRHDFGLNITSGHVRGTGVRGQYNKHNNGIRSKVANDLPVISHELGHALNHRYDLLGGKLTAELKAELENALGDMKDGYSKKHWRSEGLAEYIRKFLQNRETAAIDYPLLTKYFLNSLSAKDAALIEQLADEINAYYSLDADSATSSIRLRGEKAPDARTAAEKIKEWSSKLYQAWYDTNEGIKQYSTHVDDRRAYTLATNAAYSDAMAGQIIIGDLTDANGQYVAPGLKAALHGLDLRSEQEYRLFGEYLAVKHGPERLAEGMRAFADDRKNSTAWMKNRQAALEQQHPEFVDASTRLYEFQKQFLRTWGVGTGLVSPEMADQWAQRWSYYVPFNRLVEDKGNFIGAKRGFANQNSTIMRAKGSGLDIVHPVDNIINNIVRMVNAGVRNNVMRTITDMAENLGADATFLEKIPTPMVPKKFDATTIKDTLTNWLEESDLDRRSKETASGIMGNLDDVLVQFSKGKAHGNVITVLKNGNQEFWKINDDQLLRSVSTLSQKKLEGVLGAYASVSRFMTGNITGNNLIWSIFSNMPRDLQTLFAYSPTKNPLKVFGGVGSAYVNKIKGGTADPLYKEFLAMGGGKSGYYSADRELTKRAIAQISKAGKKFNISANPMDWIGFTSDLIESGPRYATYKFLRENGVDPQEAFYAAMDVTVNFRRGGELARQVNAFVPFFNAGMQGLDKFRRWITAEGTPKADRAKVVRNRVIAYMTVSAVLAALIYGLNNRDDETEEEYEQLSNYTKNSFWNVPLGDGYYFAIPKPRELGVLSSFFETLMERTVGENDHAFDEFYSYWADNCLPSIVSDVAQGDIYGAIGSLGIVGVGSYMMANRDFLGRPIVSNGLKYFSKPDQYNDSTSKIAYWVGQAFNTSPQMVDYFFQQILGGWWKAQKAIFPVGEKERDLTLGVLNTYIKDNAYSQDLTNWLYDQAEASVAEFKSDQGNMKKSIAAKMDSKMTDFYGNYYGIAKNEPNSVTNRGTRQTVLAMILEYRKQVESGRTTRTQSAVYSVVEATDKTGLLPAVMNTYVKDGEGNKHELSAVQYVEYQTDYNRRYWEYVEDNLDTGASASAQAATITAARNAAREDATNATLRRICAPVTEREAKYDGVDTDSVIYFEAEIDLANEDGSLKQDEVIEILKLMIANDGLSAEDAYILFHSRYDSDKNNPWKRYKP